MRGLLFVLLLLVIGLIALGFYRGWFDFSTTRDNAGTNIKLRIDEKKIESDTAKAKDKVREIFDRDKGK
jgi:hypothetical protein